jgi:hypothetical protein
MTTGVEMSAKANDTERKSELYYRLSRNELIAIFVIYIAIAVIGLVASLLTLLNVGTKELSISEILINTIIGSLAASGMFSSLQYLKRLYKACIYERVLEARSKGNFEAIGNLIYFITRPVYALAFSVGSIVVLLSGLFFILESGANMINTKFYYLCYMVSSIIGFSVGRVLDKLKTFSDRKVDKTANYFGDEE